MDGTFLYSLHFPPTLPPPSFRSPWWNRAVITIGGIVATRSIVSPLRAVDKMHFVIAIDPLEAGCSCVSGRTFIHDSVLIRTGPMRPSFPFYAQTRPSSHGWICFRCNCREVLSRLRVTGRLGWISRYIFPTRCAVLIRLFAKECYGGSTAACAIRLPRYIPELWNLLTLYKHVQPFGRDP